MLIYGKILSVHGGFSFKRLRREVIPYASSSASFMVWGSLGHGNTYFLLLQLTVTSHLLDLVQTILCDATMW